MNIPDNATADEIIGILEDAGLGWDLGHAGRLRECRIWDWPWVRGRHRPYGSEPLADMLRKAITDMEANKEVERGGKWYGA